MKKRTARNPDSTHMVTKLLRSNAPAATVLIRVAVGGIFLSEGIQKFLFPEQLGVGRFTKIGIPWPELLAPIVGGFEIVSGGLVLLGLLTRLASIPLTAIMCVAIATTKLPILASSGFWTMAHESRTDFSMLLGSLFLLIVGAGRISADHKIAARRA